MIDGKPLPATMRRLVNVQLVKLIDISKLVGRGKSTAVEEPKVREYEKNNRKTEKTKKKKTKIWLATNYSNWLIKM